MYVNRLAEAATRPPRGGERRRQREREKMDENPDAPTHTAFVKTSRWRPASYLLNQMVETADVIILIIICSCWGQVFVGFSFIFIQRGLIVTEWTWRAAAALDLFQLRVWSRRAVAELPSWILSGVDAPSNVGIGNKRASFWTIWASSNTIFPTNNSFSQST